MVCLRISGATEVVIVVSLGMVFWDVGGMWSGLLVSPSLSHTPPPPQVLTSRSPQLSSHIHHPSSSLSQYAPDYVHPPAPSVLTRNSHTSLPVPRFPHSPPLQSFYIHPIIPSYIHLIHTTPLAPSSTLNPLRHTTPRSLPS